MRDHAVLALVGGLDLLDLGVGDTRGYGHLVLDQGRVHGVVDVVDATELEAADDVGGRLGLAHRTDGLHDLGEEFEDLCCSFRRKWSA